MIATVPAGGVSPRIGAHVAVDVDVAEAHLFQEGGHGFGVRLIQGRPAEVWPDLVRAWASRLGLPL